MKDKLHIIIIFSLIIVFLIIFRVVAQFAQPDSFDKFGHYRWDAIDEIKSQKVINQSTETCADCHDGIFRLHKKDAHYSVPCVDCHGPGNLHVAFHKGGNLAEGISKNSATLPREYNLEGCLYCHRKLAARPSDFPQIDKNEHFEFLHVTDPDTKCTQCHNPHEPIFLLTEVSQSRLHPIVYRCNDCHSDPKQGNLEEIKGHPKIFECKDCHSDIVADFVKSPHNNHIDCRSCHLFHKESENTGRIYKNGNARFCLLCHENKEFKDDEYPPKIEWPEHIDNLGYKINTDEKICLDCHADKIHKMMVEKNRNPHQKNWKNIHSAFALNKESNHTNPSCNSCHKSDFCISCHKLEMPHPEEFLFMHKETVESKGRNLCKNCHATDFCSTCH